MAKVPAIASSFFSPLRYPGGKGKLAPFVKSLLTLNDLEDCHYVEPFAGGAAVALELLFHEYAKTIQINDLDPGVAAFWRSVLKNTDLLCKKISAAKLTIPEWRRQRERAACIQNIDDLELGFATFYMNRTNRSGILRGGVIGGLDQTGEWGLDARFNKDELIARIERIATLANRILFTQLDARLLLESLDNSIDTFVYMDPPYFAKGKDLYTHYYEDADHVAISNCARRLTKSKWIVSYDAVDRIDELYSKFRSIRYSLSYSAQQRYKGGEVMFFSPGLKIPDFAGPMHALQVPKVA